MINLEMTREEAEVLADLLNSTASFCDEEEVITLSKRLQALLDTREESDKS